MKQIENLKVDYKSIIPVYEQIKQHIKVNILSGNYSADEKITSVREMSRMLQVNQNTIVKAYYQLEQEGFVYSQPGRGYFVKAVKNSESREKEEVFRYETKAYLEKITAMGFSVNDAIAEMEKMN
ncbi:GntR family transcriptional regulator [Spirochaeta isovalerica]|uniref:GntR family transcriptional regulator n=1 Tax=Spirochaeta isovalerica TaxID=150 RepID=A0A841RBQ4_9SPIO|nr:GntR family transcriptional regulator [Spirochaeta isovalerica]MBB6480108.1 GntR family transcriptional regulator [Spirochaeta isovalerica]